MVYYITSVQHLSLVKELCEAKKMNFEYVTNIRDIRLFVKTEIKKLEHMKFFVIDIDCLDNSSKEIYDSICGMRYMTKAKVIAVALGRSRTDELIAALIESNACSVVLSNDTELAQKEIEAHIDDDGTEKSSVTS